jgi:hypothetical protein
VAFTVSISIDGSPVKEESNFDETYLLKNKSIMKGLKKNQKIRRVITGIINQRKECVP